ncbi:MAG: ribonuclease E/G, partial [Caulobacteraceae bacterium]|nr:ribonuclease E/G [Caulobacteraceae bacterium]
VVPLKSGGYLVINQTEALVAIDVNSGKSTRERNIGATALKTNMEAAAEAARQLRLRDLAGLIVIDFIDMDEGKNNRAVEKKLKDALKDDRARVQMGKISSFGLMEISRQRRRTGVLEGTTHVCEHCQGTGRLRSTESSALAALRAIEMEAVRNGGGAATLRAPRAIALYILNEKRAHLALVQQRHGLFVAVVIDDALSHADHLIERTESVGHEAAQVVPSTPIAFAPEPADELDYDEVEDEEDVEDEEVEDEAEAPAGEEDAGRRGGRRRRRRRGRRGEETGTAEHRAAEPAEAAAEGSVEEEDEDAGEGFDAQGRRRRRRGRRGGRRMREEGRHDDVYAWSRPRVPEGDPYIWMDAAQIAAGGSRPAHEAPVQAAPAPAVEAPVAEALAAEVPAVVEEANVIPFPASEPAEPAAGAEAPAEDVWVELPAAPEPAAKPARARRSRAKAKPAAEAAEAVVAETPVVEASTAEAPAAEAAPEPAPAEPVVAEQVAAEPEPEPAPVAASAEPEAAAQPEAPPAPPLGEILSPPEKPKRGWWRRNG